MVRHLTFAVALAVLSLLFANPVRADIVAKSALTSSGSQLGEASLGDLVADAVKESVHAQVGIIAAGCLREITIPKGKTDALSIRQCIQYPDDRVAVVELTGAEIRQALERSVSIYPQKNLGFLQIAGIRVVVHPDSPKGNRIVSVSTETGAFSDDARYQVATTAPIANGAYGYFTIWNKTEIGKSKSITVTQAVNDFLAAKVSLDYSQADRIVLKK